MPADAKGILSSLVLFLSRSVYKQGPLSIHQPLKKQFREHLAQKVDDTRRSSFLEKEDFNSDLRGPSGSNKVGGRWTLAGPQRPLIVSMVEKSFNILPSSGHNKADLGASIKRKICTLICLIECQQLTVTISNKASSGDMTVCWNQRQAIHIPVF